MAPKDIGNCNNVNAPMSKLINDNREDILEAEIIAYYNSVNVPKFITAQMMTWQICF
jgi:hypothetical protein